MNVIFDLDGTLFQTGFCLINAVNKLTKELEINKIDDTKIIDNIGKSTNLFLNSIMPSSIKTNDIKEHFRELEKREIKEHGILFPGIEAMLDELKSYGHTIIICSNGSMAYIETVLSKTGIRKYINKIYSASEHPSKIQVVEKIIHESEGVKSISVGDTLSDFQAAEENKIPSIGVLFGYGKTDDYNSATYTAKSTEELCGLIVLCDVFYKITEQLNVFSKKILGINGVDTSGKTTFTNQYSKFLLSIGINNTVLHMDDFHNPSAVRRSGQNENLAYYNNAFNYKQVIEELLEPIKRGAIVDKEILCLNLDTDKYENIIHYRIVKDTLLLIEGVLLFRPPIIDYLDGKIFLHIDFDEVLKRAVKRDVPKYGQEFIHKYLDKYIPIQQLYIAEYSPKDTADVVVLNQNYDRPSLL